MSDKPIKVKPHFYAVCLDGMKKIGIEMGYNLLIHGSINRDMDLLAVPWINTPKTHLELLHSLCDYLGVEKYNSIEHYMYSRLEGGRDSYVINLQRGMEVNGEYFDAEYYIDISITPLVVRIK